MKNKFKSVLALGATLMLATSCSESVLDLKNEGSYSDATYFKDQPQFNEAVIATYATLLQNGMWAREWYFTFDLMGNDAERAPALLGDLQQQSEFTHGTGHPQLTSTWLSLYRMGFRANVVLEKIKDWNPTSDAHKALKTRYIAEARFLRGYSNFNLVSLWGRVPLRKDYATNQEFYLGRSSTADIWKFVEDDFKAAAADLPARMPSADLGRATKGAAQAMLGKSFLYQKKYAEAQAQFEAVVNTGGYSLNPSYDNQFSKTNSKSPESIFDVPHRWFGWGTNGANQYYMFGGQEGWGGQTTHTGRAQEYGFNDWKNVYVSDALAAAFTYNDESGAKYQDPRAKFVMYGDAASGADVDYCNSCAKGKINYDFNAFGYRWRKYQPYEEQERIDGPQSEINSQIIRLADVMLMLAETYIEQGANDKALPLINNVRKRVGAFEYTSLGDKAAATTKLRRERQLELSGEQHRYFDLVRWGVLKQTLNPEKNAIISKYPTLKQNPVEDKHLLFPIPQQEKDTNPEVAKDVANEWN
jgi:starch-binding outer membrane protein, SusD/RagB family